MEVVSFAVILTDLAPASKSEALTETYH
ncbi:hypothetical protein EYZ11_003780 [Aspergillus tanneri]|uniref:Uncharacterized protein n=1 Tax=Aspergillus tanneri TaxID=1220188 RepID=A0A4S3JME2_9EURO|nr:hypothetical protein EYZ11_003780 [Aspergillus tanneri]